MSTIIAAATALPPVVFPLSGPPVCVAFRHPSAAGCMRVGTGAATFIELAMHTIHPTMAEKFYLEPSEQHKGLVHVRSCGNNKYWVAEQHERDGSGTSWFICSTADKPEEDLTKPSCTLFEFTQSDHLDGNHARVIQQQQKKPVVLKSTLTGNFNLEVRDPGTYMDDGIPPFIRVCRLSVQKQLPRYVAFKGSNGKYLRLNGEHLQFSLDDIANPAVVHQTFTDEYGNTRLLSSGSHRNWRLRPEGWICTQSYLQTFFDNEEEVYADINTLFRIDILSGNYVALRSRSSSLFCTKFTNKEKTDCLSALVYDIKSTIDAELEIVEPVKSREIYDVRYRYNEAKKTSIKREPSRTLVIGTNRSDDVAQSQTTIEQYERTESRWDATSSFDVGIQASLEASVPVLEDIVNLGGSVGGHANVTGEYKWQESKVKETKTTTVISYPLAPKTKKMCTIFAAKEVLEVPFSYRKKDVLYSGEVVHSDLLHDGMYSGMEVNEIDYDITSENIE